MAIVLLKTALFTLVVPGTVTVLVPYLLLTSGNGSLLVPAGALHYAGALPILLGAAIYVWCAWDFASAGRGTPAPIDAPRELVVRGLYRTVRNPMYLGVLLVLLGEALLFGSLRLLVYATGIFLLFHLVVTLYEEPTLRRRFGEAYKSYGERVPRWLPRRPHA